MSKPTTIQIWLTQIRTNFLALAVLLVFIGVAAAWRIPGAQSDFSWINAFLLMIGIVSAHASVNLFNEYSDYHTGIDFNVTRTPFSGGTGMLIEGHTRPRQVLLAALFTLLVAAAIGTYFTVMAHSSIAVIMLIGAVSIVLYTPFFARIAMGELISGLSLGSLVVIGSYIAMTATPGQPFTAVLPSSVIYFSIAPGILTSLLLFINEFPDADADRKGGRRHLVILLGRRASSWIYVAGLVATFTMVIWMVGNNTLNYWGLLALLPLPLAIKAGVTALRFYDNPPALIPGLVANVMTVLATDLLLGVAVLLM